MRAHSLRLEPLFLRQFPPAPQQTHRRLRLQPVCRLAYINFVLESGASVKEAQALARHSTPELTMNVYGRTRKERLSETAEKVAANVLPAADNARFMPRQAVGAEQETQPSDLQKVALFENGGGGGNRTPRQLFLMRAVPIQNPHKSVQIKALQILTKCAPNRIRTLLCNYQAHLCT